MTVKYAYALGVQHALDTLISKTAAAPAISPPSFGSTRMSKTPTWGLGGKTPQGFNSQDPASIQAGAQPGGPPQLAGAPLAATPTRGASTPGFVVPSGNPGISQPGATGITAPLEAKAIPGAGTQQSLGIPSGGSPTGPSTKQ